MAQAMQEAQNGRSRKRSYPLGDGGIGRGTGDVSGGGQEADRCRRSSAITPIPCARPRPTTCPTVPSRRCPVTPSKRRPASLTPKAWKPRSRYPAQAIKYREFCDRIAASGCVGYFVSFAGHRAAYYGRTGDTYVEWFPGAKHDLVGRASIRTRSVLCRRISASGFASSPIRSRTRSA